MGLVFEIIIIVMIMIRLKQCLLGGNNNLLLSRVVQLIFSARLMRTLGSRSLWRRNKNYCHLTTRNSKTFTRPPNNDLEPQEQSFANDPQSICTLMADK